MFEAFAIGVSLRLMDRVTPGLLGMTTHFRKAGAEAELLQAKVARIGKTMAIGTAMAGAGVGILATLKPAITEATKFQTEVAKFSLYGLGDKANAEAVRFAKSMKIVGSSYVDNMRLITESQGIFRESGKLTITQQLEGAKIAAPILAKLSFIESSLSDDKRAAAHTQDLAMLRFIESRGGANDPRTFAGIADWGFRLSKSSGGVVPWSQLQQLAATSGVAGFNLSQNAIAKLEPVVADLTGGRTGSGLRVAFQRLLGTQRGLPVQAISEFLKLGLWDPTKVALKSGGGIDHFIGRPGAVLRDRELFATDPFEFYKRDFLPALAKKYGASILGDSVQARTERAVETNLIFGPGTAGAVFAQMDKLAPAIARSVAAQNKTMGIDAAMQAAGNTLAGKRIAARKAFDDTLELTGEAILPLATRAMGALLPAIQKVNAFATAHPRMFDGIIKGIAGLGVAMVAGGVVTNLVATGQALKLVGGLARAAVFAKDVGLIARSAGLITAGLETVEVALAGMSIVIGAPVGVIVATGTAIAAAVAGIGIGLYQMWRHWDSSRTVFQNLKAELGMFINWIKSIPGALFNMLPGWARKMVGPWSRADGAPGATALPKAGAPKPITYLQSNGRLDVRATADFVKKGAHFIVPADWAKEHPAAIAAGKAVGQGLAQGVMAAHPAVRAAAAGSAGQAVAGFKKAADIHSPSRVFAGLGDMLVQGLILGLDRSAPSLFARLGDLGRSAIGIFRGMGQAGGGLAQHLTGAVSQRAAEAMTFFRAHGWNAAQAAGITANLIRESGLNAAAVNARSGAFGAAQWLGSRVKDFQAVTGHALRGSSLMQQLAFVDHELRSTHASVGRALLTTRTPAAAAALFNAKFEANGVAGEGGRRAGLAEQLVSRLRPPPAALPIRFGTMAPVAPILRPTIIQRWLSTTRTAVSTITHLHRAPSAPALTPLARFVPARVVAAAQKSGEPQRSPFVRSMDHTTVHHTSIHMDGKKVAEVVTRHQAHSLRGPARSSSFFDPTMAPAHPGDHYGM